MRVKLQLVICDDGHEETITDVVTLKKDHRRIEHLGLTLAEAKQLLKTVQHRVPSNDRLPRFSTRALRVRTVAPHCRPKVIITRGYRFLADTAKAYSAQPPDAWDGVIEMVDK